MAGDQRARDRRFFAGAAVFGFAVFIALLSTGRNHWFVSLLALVCAIASTVLWWLSR